MNNDEIEYRLSKAIHYSSRYIGPTERLELLNELLPVVRNIVDEEKATTQATLDRAWALVKAWERQARSWRAIATRSSGPSNAAYALRRALTGPVDDKK